ncbi:MAG: TIGR03087 family PEP-CTERM/XrtA system glycosyltransferase [Parvularcula sp.]
MTGKPAILMLCHRIPYPPDKGDKIRAWHLLKHLSQSYDVSLGCFIDDPADEVYRPVVEKICKQTKIISINPTIARLKSLKALVRGRPLSLDYYDRRAMRDWVASVRAKGVVAEIAYSSTMAPYLAGAQTPTLIDLVDADSAKFTAYGTQGMLHEKLIYGREGRRLAAFESALTHTAQKVFLVSPEEADMVRALPGAEAGTVDWYRNGVDTAYWRADADFSKAESRFDLVFTGAMDYRPNIEAVTSFVRDIWTHLAAENPELTFGIVGARPVKEVTALAAQPGVHVTGRVDDMRPYLVAAKIAVAPLAIARGVQNKVLEAMAMGTPVVASRAAILGTGAAPGEHLVEANGAEETIAAVRALLDDPDRAYSLSAAASAFIAREFPWDKTLTRFDDALAAALSSSDASS